MKERPHIDHVCGRCIHYYDFPDCEDENAEYDKPPFDDELIKCANFEREKGDPR